MLNSSTMPSSSRNKPMYLWEKRLWEIITDELNLNEDTELDKIVDDVEGYFRSNNLDYKSILGTGKLSGISRATKFKNGLTLDIRDRLRDTSSSTSAKLRKSIRSTRRFEPVKLRIKSRSPSPDDTDLRVKSPDDTNGKEDKPPIGQLAKKRRSPSKSRKRVAKKRRPPSKRLIQLKKSDKSHELKKLNEYAQIQLAKEMSQLNEYERQHKNHIEKKKISDENEEKERADQMRMQDTLSHLREIISNLNEKLGAAQINSSEQQAKYLQDLYNAHGQIEKLQAQANFSEQRAFELGKGKGAAEDYAAMVKKDRANNSQLAAKDVASLQNTIIGQDEKLQQLSKAYKSKLQELTSELTVVRNDNKNQTAAVVQELNARIQNLTSEHATAMERLDEKYSTSALASIESLGSFQDNAQKELKALNERFEKVEKDKNDEMARNEALLQEQRYKEIKVQREIEDRDNTIRAANKDVQELLTQLRTAEALNLNRDQKDQDVKMEMERLLSKIQELQETNNKVMQTNIASMNEGKHSDPATAVVSASADAMDSDDDDSEGSDSDDPPGAPAGVIGAVYTGKTQDEIDEAEVDTVQLSFRHKFNNVYKDIEKLKVFRTSEYNKEDARNFAEFSFVYDGSGAGNRETARGMNVLHNQNITDDLLHGLDNYVTNRPDDMLFVEAGYSSGSIFPESKLVPKRVPLITNFNLDPNLIVQNRDTKDTQKIITEGNTHFETKDTPITISAL